MEKIVRINNIEIYEFCKLNLDTGEKVFYGDSPVSEKMKGFYFKDNNTFFALYSTENGPIIYYEGREYPLKKELHISLTKKGKNRQFTIEEYNINISYLTSPYIGFDVWSEEEDVDLFYQIEQSYKNDEYYEKFTN